MKVVYYSEQCEYSKKLLAYLDKNNIKNLFKFVNIDNTDVPDTIDKVPLIIDSNLNEPMKGKKAFEYLLNLKYFNNPTNNIEHVKELPANPNIPEDDKAIKSKTSSFELNSTNSTNNNTEMILNDLFNDSLKKEYESDAKKFHDSVANNTTEQSTQKMMVQRKSQDNKLAILMRMKRK
jgi:hypothetical protein